MLNLWLLAAIIVALAGYYFYWGLFPNPLPGVPYDADSAKRPLGDIPEIKAAAQDTGEFIGSRFTVARRLGLPVTQLLLPRILRRNVVMLNDPIEAEDILTRRHHEFDRSIITRQYFLPFFPHSTIAQETTPELKAQKRLWAPVMNTTFLNQVVAPNVHLAGRELVELWRTKAQQSPGQPFEAAKDFGNAALDAIWVAVLGSSLGVTRSEIERLQKTQHKEELASRTGDESNHSKVSAAIVQEAMQYLNKIVDIGFTATFQPLALFLVKLSPKFRRFKKITYDEVNKLMVQACERYQRVKCLDTENDGERLDTCAMDLVLRREVLMARKNGQPVPDPTKNPAMLQELLLLLLAGHDSTAGVLSWFVKLMPQHPSVQTTLRQTSTPPSLLTTLPAPSPLPPKSLPPPPLPRRHHRGNPPLLSPTAAVPRVAKVDTTILGYPIHKGTLVTMNTRFDSSYKPWGKKLAMRELTIITTLLILSFEFLPLPEGGDDMLPRERLFRQPKACVVNLRPL
ncbi:hypothetical protein N0V88_002678 [Collariella sp. IMI 366227]|nr:hypothetical protein N0V88_002678 [Collariella sp. IMI 366227]